MWTETDSILESAYERQLKAKKLIEKYKESPIEDINFLANYLNDLLDDYYYIEGKKNKYWEVMNLLNSERNDCYKYLKDLRRIARASAIMLKDDMRIDMIDKLNDKLENLKKDYDEKYKYYEKVIPFDITWRG